ncbi:acetyl-CoA C-acetyltransferase [Gimesia maris]|uniref:Acetyl-CoA acetyltransferase n=1 Tax=Gimesia maris TaxID=122 RepID=A0ABX5YPZ8_9PLAN|nr:acetyl-CoA C-acetyltransferase [Gimesia maris]EDL60438.1 acetyl-CoA acetyltransferase [Gimesia maris DSM 8797]QDU15777.1 Acetyl-CoA acetyltransferase [Gimesia maris]QEG17800.1 Acetyl-CoA acetyltransferase [Gimesia maris]QGQ29161.1 acetyl-CoA C-acetyltransferase [Gimesia maris]
MSQQKQTRVAVLSAARTPIGAFNGAFKDLSAVNLGTIVAKETLKRGQLSASQVDEVFLGQVFTAGCGMNPARQVALNAGMPFGVPATTVNMVCGSGLKSVALGVQSILCGNARVVLAGGMESMSNAPYLLQGARSGYRMGNQQLVDSMIHDALWDAFYDCHMGITAENLSEKYDISREAQDRYAVQSQERCQAAIEAGKFEKEIVSVHVTSRKKEATLVTDDEYPRKGTSYETISCLRPAFKPEGTVTAANSSGINDGAATLLIAGESFVEDNKLQPLAWIRAFSNVGLDPQFMGMGPAHAVDALLKAEKLKLKDIGLLEVNEAFAAQTLAVGKTLNWDEERVNVNGGAIALGHPLGASGSRIAVSLLHEMQKRKTQHGIASLCIGGGMGIAMLFEAA